MATSLFSGPTGGSLRVSDILARTNSFAQSGQASFSQFGKLGSFGSPGAVSAVWGQDIPITWGRVKITVPIIQIGPAAKTVIPVNEIWRSGPNSSEGVISVTYYACDFVAALGYAGDPTIRKIINRMWIDGQLVYQEGAPSLTRQNFAFYPVSETRGVPDVLIDDTLDPLAYRGLQFAILLNYIIGGGGRPLQSTVPSVEVELFDFDIPATPKTDLTPIDPLATYPNVSDQSSFYDYDTGTIFTIDSDDTIHVWDVESGEEIDSYPITNKTPGWTAVGAGGTAATSFLKINGKRFMTAEQDNASNVNHFVVINLDTGAVTDSFGLTNSGNVFFLNDFGGDSISNQVEHFAFVAGRFGKQQGYVLMPTLGSGEFLWRITDDGELRCITFDNVFPRPKKISREGVLDSVTGNAYFIITREPSAAGQETTELLVITPTNSVATSSTSIAGAGTGYYLLSAFPTIDDHFVLLETNGTLRNIRKIDPKTGTVVATLTGVAGFSVVQSKWFDQSSTRGRYLGWLNAAGQTFYKLDMLTMTIDTWALTGSVSFSGNPLYDAVDNKFYTPSTTAVSQINVGPQNTAEVALSDILEGICVRAGYDPADVIIENIDDTVIGAILPARFNLRDVLNDLSGVYRFKIIEREGKIVLTRRLRGTSFGGVDHEVYEADRAVLEVEGDKYISIRTRRTTDSNVPSTVSLTYIDPNYNYQPNTYSYRRPEGTTLSTASAEYKVPIVMTQAKAAALATALTYDAWSARLEHDFRVTQKFLSMEPGDTLNLHRDGFVDLCEIIELTVNGDFSIDVVARSITSTEVPVYNINDMDLPLVDDAVLYGDGRGKTVVIDSTVLNPEDVYDDTRTTFYLAPINAGRGAWPGGSSYFSPDAGFPLDKVGTALAEAITGKLLTALTDTNWLGIDDTETGNIDIRVSTGDITLITSVTTEQMLQGQNRVFIGAPGRWEIIGFETITDNLDGTVTLSNTVRGMKGTDINMGSHALNDTCVFNYLLEQVPFPVTSDIALDGNVCQAKSGFDSVALSLSPPDSFTFNKNGRKPLAVLNPRATASTNDIIFTWNRRTRRGETMIDESDFQELDESAEQYEIDIYSGSTIVRTVTGITSETYTYTSANQTTDGFTPPQSSIKVAIYQVSPVAGRGFARSVTLDVE